MSRSSLMEAISTTIQLWAKIPEAHLDRIFDCSVGRACMSAKVLKAIRTRRAFVNAVLMISVLGAFQLWHSSFAGQAGDGVAREKPAAILAAVEGIVWINRKGAPEPIPAEVGLRLQTGDNVRAGEESAATIYFSGGNIVRIPPGNRLEILKDPARSSPGTRRVAEMSDRTLKILEEGLWILTDPGGGVLLGSMRGEGEESYPPSGTQEHVLLSPRRELVITNRPEFFWLSDGSMIGVVIAANDQIFWRSGEIAGSSLVYPESAPSLPPGSDFQWWLESPNTRMPLTEAVEFQIPVAEVFHDIASFESALVNQFPGGEHETMIDFLRCAFYQRMRAWTPLLRAAKRLEVSNVGKGFGSNTARIARLQLGLSEDFVKALIESGGH
jgi:hypothetical protein